MAADDYAKGLKLDKNSYEDYFRKSLVKTEQQKFLETLFSFDLLDDYKIADIACGGGTLSYHLSKIFTNSSFTLIDYLSDALEIAKDINKDFSNCTYIQDDIYSLSSQPDDYHDIVFCWQTLSWLEEPEKALQQLLRITKPGGTIFLSSLFNLDHHVDTYSKVFDLTRESGVSNIPYNYNTYSEKTIRAWIGKSVNGINFYKFETDVSFNYSGKGIGTYTVDMADGKKLQISAGILLNWAILQINK